jgi:hypothetical protein
MNQQMETQTPILESLILAEEHVRCHLVGRVHNFQLLLEPRGLILRGHAHTYYAKQLAQHAVMETTRLPIQANEIDVS